MSPLTLMSFWASILITNSMPLSDGSMFGTIAWELSLKDTDLCVHSIELYVSSTVMGMGKIHWDLHGDDNSVNLTPGSTWKTYDLAGSKRLVLTAVMSSFKDCRSTQLLPARKDNADEGTTLRMEVKLKGEN